MNKSLVFFAVLYGVFMSVPPLSRAQVAALIPIQGTLVDSAGNAVHGKHDLSFGLYNNEAGAGAALFTENHPGVDVTNGRFTVYLGSASNGSLNLAFFRDNPNVWLQVTIDATEKLFPLFRLATVPYAAYAQQCVDSQTLAGRGPTSYALAEDGLKFLGSGCGDSGYVPQWDNAQKRWFCSKISLATGFTGQDAVNAVTSAGFMKDTDVAPKARAACYDDTDPDGTIPAAKVDLSSYAKTEWVSSELATRPTQTSISGAIETAAKNAVSNAGYATTTWVSETFAKKTDIGNTSGAGTSITWSTLDVPADIRDGDDNTTYTAGTGLTLSSNQFSLTQKTVEDYARGVCYDSADKIPATLLNISSFIQTGSINEDGNSTSSSTSSWTLNTGSGERIFRRPVTFSPAFNSAPRVVTTISLLDAGINSGIRFSVYPENIGPGGFDFVIRTWSSSIVIAVAGYWVAIAQ